MSDIENPAPDTAQAVPPTPAPDAPASVDERPPAGRTTPGVPQGPPASDAGDPYQRFPRVWPD